MAEEVDLVVAGVLEDKVLTSWEGEVCGELLELCITRRANRVEKKSYTS